MLNRKGEASEEAVIRRLGGFKGGMERMDRIIARIGEQGDKTKPLISRLAQAFGDFKSKA